MCKTILPTTYNSIWLLWLLFVCFRVLWFICQIITTSLVMGSVNIYHSYFTTKSSVVLAKVQRLLAAKITPYFDHSKISSATFLSFICEISIHNPKLTYPHRKNKSSLCLLYIVNQWNYDIGGLVVCPLPFFELYHNENWQYSEIL